MNKLLPILALLFFSCDEDNPVASDTTAPTATITYPANGATLSAQTTISVNVVDDSDIASVVFIVNGSEAFTDTESPYEYSWDVCALTEENATILVNASDSAGNVGVSSLLTYSVDASYDECSVCGGDNSVCLDCLGVPNGDAVVDECGVCDGGGVQQDCGCGLDGTLDLEDLNNGDGACDCDSNVLDCFGDCGGSAVFDCIGVCGGDTVIDECGNCGIVSDYWAEEFTDTIGGDGIYSPGEGLTFGGGWNDIGLDGIPGTGDEGEGDGLWQPGDNWIDTNGDGYASWVTDDWEACQDVDGDGLCGFYETIFSSLQDCINTVFLDNRCLTYGTDGDVFYDGNGDGEYTSTTDVYYNENFFNDVWPPLNNVYDQGEVFLDCGVDNLCPGDNGYIEPDFGEGNGTFDSCP